MKSGAVTGANRSSVDPEPENQSPGESSTDADADVAIRQRSRGKRGQHDGPEFGARPGG